MKYHDTSGRMSATGRKLSPSGIVLLEEELTDLREENVRLQRRLEEIEMTEALRVRASRILAIRPLEER